VLVPFLQLTILEALSMFSKRKVLLGLSAWHLSLRHETWSPQNREDVATIQPPAQVDGNIAFFSKIVNGLGTSQRTSALLVHGYERARIMAWV
jgi:hypothetical protein